MTLTVADDNLRFEELCFPTLNALSNAGFKHLGEEVLTKELISDFAENSYSIAWKNRKSNSGETDPRSFRAYQDLGSGEQAFIHSLATGKLSYLISFVTRAGFKEMLRLGEEGLSLREVGLTSDIDIRDNLARLHHENWLNQNCEIGRISPWNYEWGEYPSERSHGYELQRIQVDMDCRAMSELSASGKAHLLGLTIPSENNTFFHEGSMLSVRSGKPAPPAGEIINF